MNFSQNGYHVSFDASGDPVARYELVNWQKRESGNIEMVTVGYFDASLPVGQKFQISKNLTWADGGTEVKIYTVQDERQFFIEKTYYHNHLEHLFFYLQYCKENKWLQTIQNKHLCEYCFNTDLNHSFICFTLY